MKYAWPVIVALVVVAVLLLAPRANRYRASVLVKDDCRAAIQVSAGSGAFGRDTAVQWTDGEALYVVEVGSVRWGCAHTGTRVDEVSRLD